MIELLVSVVILVIIMLAFGMIITTIQGTVSTGQEGMRSNAAAASIIGTLRGDIRQITRHGCLAITQTDHTEAPVLVFTTAGVIPSKTDSASATGGLVSLGICENQASGDVDVLYSRSWVLSSASSLGAGDAFVLDLAHVQIRNRDFINGWLIEQYCRIPPANVFLPANELDHVNALWQVLADNCEWISIMWTDGITWGTTGLVWYGVDYDQDAPGYVLRPKEPNWSDPNHQAADWAADVAMIEFDGDPGFATLYRALWTHHNQNNWPRALKIKFKLEDHDSPYEVICPIGG